MAQPFSRPRPITPKIPSFTLPSTLENDRYADGDDHQLGGRQAQFLELWSLLAILRQSWLTVVGCVDRGIPPYKYMFQNKYRLPIEVGFLSELPTLRAPAWAVGVCEEDKLAATAPYALLVCIHVSIWMCVDTLTLVLLTGLC